MDKQTRDAFDWLMDKYDQPNDLLRSYPINMVIFIAGCCAEYHKTALEAIKLEQEDVQ